MLAGKRLGAKRCLLHVSRCSRTTLNTKLAECKIVQRDTVLNMSHVMLLSEHQHAN